MSQAEQENTGLVRHSGWYGAARVVATAMFHTLFPVKYRGAERLSLDAPYIVIANHQSWIDPVVVALPVKRYEICFLGKKELVKTSAARKILTNMHMIIVDRHNMDMEAMRACMKVVRDGNVLGIFPEGTRHHKGLMNEIETGVALMAMRANVPLVPVYIPHKLTFLRRTDVQVGEPIPMEDLRAQGINRETCAALLERITETYAKMAEKT